MEITTSDLKGESTESIVSWATKIVGNHLQGIAVEDKTHVISCIAQDVAMEIKNREDDPKGYVSDLIKKLVAAVPVKAITEVALTTTISKKHTSKVSKHVEIELCKETLELLRSDERTALLMKANGKSYMDLSIELNCSRPHARRILVRAQREYFRLLTQSETPLLDRFVDRKEST